MYEILRGSMQVLLEEIYVVYSAGKKRKTPTQVERNTESTNIAIRMDGEPPPAPAPLFMHPAVAPLSFLLGTWRGQGDGGFPTINSFSYGEELHFSHSGKPVISYTQKTWKLDSREPMHAESGYWRPKPDGSIEVVIAQSTGLVEVQKGTYIADEKVIKLQSSLVGNASKVKDITRVFKLEDGNLSYVVQMATGLTGLQPHLKALLTKV